MQKNIWRQIQTQERTVKVFLGDLKKKLGQDLKKSN